MMEWGEKKKKKKKKKTFVLLSRVVRSSSVDPRCVPQTQVIRWRLCCSFLFFSFFWLVSDAFRAVLCLDMMTRPAAAASDGTLRDKRQKAFFGTIFYRYLLYFFSFVCCLLSSRDPFATINFSLFSRFPTSFPIFGGNIACVFLPVSQLEVSSKFERRSVPSPGKELFRFSPRSESSKPRDSHLGRRRRRRRRKRKVYHRDTDHLRRRRRLLLLLRS